MADCEIEKLNNNKDNFFDYINKFLKFDIVHYFKNSPSFFEDINKEYCSDYLIKHFCQDFVIIKLNQNNINLIKCYIKEFHDYHVIGHYQLSYDGQKNKKAIMVKYFSEEDLAAITYYKSHQYPENNHNFIREIPDCLFNLDDTYLI